ncbi:MAG: hypothetical protein ACREBR_02075 [bacterium]
MTTVFLILGHRLTADSPFKFIHPELVPRDGFKVEPPDPGMYLEHLRQELSRTSRPTMDIHRRKRKTPHKPICGMASLYPNASFDDVADDNFFVLKRPDLVRKNSMEKTDLEEHTFVHPRAYLGLDGAAEQRALIVKHLESIHPERKGGFPIVFDCGASKTITPYEDDFIGEIRRPPPGMELKGISSGLPIRGIGTIKWLFTDTTGQVHPLTTEAYFVPLMTIRLFSPQAHVIEQDEIKSGISFEHPATHMHFKWNKGKTMMSIPLHPPTKLYIAKGHPPRSIGGILNICVTDATNSNLSGTQKLLLRWHYRLGHVGFALVQWLARNSIILPSSIARCEAPKCASCEYGKGHRRPVANRGSPGQYAPRAGGRISDSKIDSLLIQTGGHLKAGDLRPGDRISVDSYETRVKGRRKTSRGQTKDSDMFCGGTIFCDHASSFIDVRHQVTLGAHDTVRSKQLFERVAYTHGVQVKAYHADNGIFTSHQFKQHLEDQAQDLSLSGVGAHHQNGVAERAIKTVVASARTMMLHAALRWPEEKDESLWPLALCYAAYIHNITPKPNCGGHSPLELFSSVITEHPMRAVAGKPPHACLGLSCLCSGSYLTRREEATEVTAAIAERYVHGSFT